MSAARAAAALPPGFFQGASLHNLRQLVMMRNIAIVAQACTVLVVSEGLSIDLPVVALGAVIATLALFNLATWRRVLSEHPVSDNELCAQLLVDVLALALLLGLSGGSTNPFIGMFVLPLTITAACLSSTYTWLVALATVAAYSVLVLVHRPILVSGNEAWHMKLLVSGMWVNYVITAAMIAHFVVRIASNLRAAHQQRASTREREIQEEHLARIGTLAAGAAHELAQPLSTMAAIVDDLQDRARQAPDVQPLARELEQQLRHCQDTLSALLSYGHQTIDGSLQTEPADAFVRGCVDAHNARRPGAPVQLKVASGGASPALAHDLALRQAVLNLLGNAADASQEPIELNLSWDEGWISIEIRDHGTGLSPEAAERVGKLFFTTKPLGSGNGLGLCLAQVAVTRLGGSLLLTNAAGGGALARVLLPVAAAQ